MKKFVSTLIGLALVAPAAFGFPGMDIVQKKAKELAAQSQASSRDGVRSAACTNFSGHWKGQCTVNGQSATASEFTITQNGCTSLSSGQEEVSIGGLQTGSKTPERVADGSYATASSMDWNADQSQLSLQFIALIKGGQHTVPIYGKGTERIENSQLIFEMDVAGTKVNCTHSKQ